VHVGRRQDRLADDLPESESRDAKKPLVEILGDLVGHSKKRVYSATKIVRERDERITLNDLLPSGINKWKAYPSASGPAK